MFNHPFREVAREYLLTQEARATRGEISEARPKKVRAVLEGALKRDAGSIQVHLIWRNVFARLSGVAAGERSGSQQAQRRS